MALKRVYDEIPAIKLRNNAANYIGKKFGKITVMYPIRSGRHHLIWLGECECGTQVEIRASQLANDSIRNCGRCEHLPRHPKLKEIPYTIVTEENQPAGQITEQDDMFKREVSDSLDAIFDDSELEDVIDYKEYCTVEDVIEHAKVTDAVSEDVLTAWQTAEKCCALFNKLEQNDQIKALNLMRVELGFDI